jgi:hypothetical protein
VFDQTKRTYNEALSACGYSEKINYNVSNGAADDNNKNKHKNRKRNIIWFNPPYSGNVKSNIGRTFLKLINKHFPKRSKLHKIFNQNNVKVSYSCMRSMGSIIRTHNSCIRRKENHEAPKKECNCRAKGSCPLRGKCLTESIVYKATVKSGETSKFYVGLSGGKFKDRYNNHTKSLKHKKYEKETELSKYVWALKQKNSEYTII